MSKKKSYMEKMTEKYGTAESRAASTDYNNIGSDNGSLSYMDRMNAKYGSNK